MLQLTLFCFSFFLSISPIAAQIDEYSQSINSGETAMTNRQYAQAIQYFGQAIKVNPAKPEAYLHQMEAAILKRDLSVFKRNILQLEGLEYPLILDIYLTYAQLAKKQRLYNDGLDILVKAEAKYPKTKNIYLERAGIYQKLSNNAEAIKAFNQALQLDTKDMDVLYQLATLYIDVNIPKSIELFNQLLLHENYKDISLTSLALLHTKLYEINPVKNRLELMKALDYYTEYYKRHPQDLDTKSVIWNIQILIDNW